MRNANTEIDDCTAAQLHCRTAADNPALIQSAALVLLLQVNTLRAAKRGLKVTKRRHLMILQIAYGNHIVHDCTGNANAPRIKRTMLHHRLDLHKHLSAVAVYGLCYLQRLGIARLLFAGNIALGIGKAAA